MMIPQSAPVLFPLLITRASLLEINRKRSRNAWAAAKRAERFRPKEPSRPANGPFGSGNMFSLLIQTKGKQRETGKVFSFMPGVSQCPDCTPNADFTAPIAPMLQRKPQGSVIKLITPGPNACLISGLTCLAQINP